MEDGPPPPPYIVPPELIAAFKRDGVVVLPDVFTAEEMAAARAGMAATLRAHGVVSSRTPE
jgi:NAD(P)H-dependent flavin oxidoreductase YrpB (nitropropane dioxygenase family)